MQKYLGSVLYEIGQILVLYFQQQNTLRTCIRYLTKAFAWACNGQNKKKPNCI